MNTYNLPGILRFVSVAVTPVRTRDSGPGAGRGALFLLIGLLLLVAGCASAPETSPRPADAARTKAPDPFVGLQKGMTAEEVKNLVGEPKEIKPLIAAGLKGEDWLYDHTIADFTKSVGSGTQDMPVTNPLTGATSVAPQTVMTEEYVTVHETVDVLMFDGRVIELKRKQWSDRKIY
jgi:hypothetical protein